MKWYTNLSRLASPLDSGLHSVSRVMAIIAAYTLVVMMLLTVADVTGRYFFNKPVLGTYELVGLMLICAGTWGLAYCQIQQGHIRVGVLFDRFSQRLQTIFNTLAYVIGIVGLSLICWQTVLMAKEYFSFGDQGISPTLGLPIAPFILVLSVGTGMMTVTLLVDLFRPITRSTRTILISAFLIIGLGLGGWLLIDAIALNRAMIGILGIAVLLTIIFLGVHIGSALIIVGFAGFALIAGLDPSLANMAIIPFQKVNSSTFAVVPLFLLMSAFVANSGIGKDAYDSVRSWIGHTRGGLAMATVGACGLFAAVSGSSMAGAIAMGKIAHPEMKRYGYDSSLSVGCIAAGGTLGILIPPSLGFIIIGLLTELSIGRLFMAGIIPGLLEVVFYVCTIYILCRLNPRLGPSASKTTFKTKIISLGPTWPLVLLFALVMGGIYGGVFTPTEAGGIGAFGALVIGLIRGKLSRSGFFDSLMDTARIASMIILLLIGAFILNAFLAITRIPFVASEFIVGLGLSKYLILAIILFSYIILGMFFDAMAILVLTIPIIFPAIIALGFDPLWYGVIMVRVVEIGWITPPFGLNLFALAGTIDVPVGILYRGVIPFVIADIFHVALLIAVPLLSTYLPSLM